MHIILGLLTSIITVLYLLDRMGIDLGGMNPFYWRRRRAWSKKYQGDPIYAIEDPMELAALFIVAVAKLDGDITAEQKNTILAEFHASFSLSERDAAQLLGASTHLLGPPQVLRSQLDGLLRRKDDPFSVEQAESLTAIMRKVAAADAAPGIEQQALITEVAERYAAPAPGGGTWG